ncbi:MAG: hypothetical protein JWM02_1080 [Frankiales bacterium]|nr:hypothetical protein [Frankiales bacterium]
MTLDVRLIMAMVALSLGSACGAGARVNTVSTTTASSPAKGGAAACSSTPPQGNSSVQVDWVDFVQLEGHQYLAGLDGTVHPVPRSSLGTVVGRVRCELSTVEYSQAPGPAADGDAAFLSVGTEVYSVRGFDPACRVAALRDGAYRVFLAHRDVAGRSRAVPCAQAPVATR